LAWNCISIALGILLSIIIFGERFAIKGAIAAVLLTVAMFLAE
jgi:uncharacterized membrane protein